MELTLDSIWNEDIRIVQPKSGYRFTVDAVLLAHFLKSGSLDEALEIGAGTGVISILFSRLQPYKHLTAVEIQKELADLARQNLETNRVPSAIVLVVDARTLGRQFPLESWDLIFSNPPYRKVGMGKLNPDSQKAVARHELKLKLEDLFVCAAKFLKPAGRLSVILPDFREKDFRKLAGEHQFHWHELQYVHSFASESPCFFLATLGKQPDSFRHYPPITIYVAPGQYTSQMQRLLKKP